MNTEMCYSSNRTEENGKFYAGSLRRLCIKIYSSKALYLLEVGLGYAFGNLQSANIMKVKSIKNLKGSRLVSNFNWWCLLLDL